MGQKGHIIDQTGLKMYEERQKMQFSDLKYLFFGGIFLSGIGGYLEKKSANQFLTGSLMAIHL